MPSRHCRLLRPWPRGREAGPRGEAALAIWWPLPEYGQSSTAALSGRHRWGSLDVPDVATLRFPHASLPSPLELHLLVPLVPPPRWARRCQIRRQRLPQTVRECGSQRLSIYLSVCLSIYLSIYPHLLYPILYLSEHASPVVRQSSRISGRLRGSQRSSEMRLWDVAPKALRAGPPRGSPLPPLPRMAAVTL